MTAIKVEVVSAEKSLYSGDAEMVVAPGVSGELGILPRHAPLLTLIRPGLLKLVQSGGGGGIHLCFRRRFGGAAGSSHGAG